MGSKRVGKRGTQQTRWKVFQPKVLCSYYIFMWYTQLYANVERSKLPGDSILYLCRENFVSASNLIFCHNLNSHLKPKRVFFYSRYSEDEDWAQDRLDLYCRYNNTASQPHSEGVWLHDIYNIHTSPGQHLCIIPKFRMIGRGDVCEGSCRFYNVFLLLKLFWQNI